MKSPSQRGRAARNKGNSFERAIVNKFKEVFPNARRTDESYIGKGVDLAHTGPFLIQTKAYRNYAPIAKIEEVPRDDITKIPVLVTKGDRKEVMAVLPLDDLIGLIKSIQGASND